MSYEQYAGYPHLQALPVGDRVKMFEETILEQLQRRRLTPEVLREQLPEAEAAENYELAQGIRNALDRFAAIPQLRLL